VIEKRQKADGAGTNAGKTGGGDLITIREKSRKRSELRIGAAWGRLRSIEENRIPSNLRKGAKDSPPALSTKEKRKE